MTGTQSCNSPSHKRTRRRIHSLFLLPPCTERDQGNSGSFMPLNHVTLASEISASYWITRPSKLLLDPHSRLATLATVPIRLIPRGAARQRQLMSGDREDSGQTACCLQGEFPSARATLPRGSRRPPPAHAPSRQT